jgi:hypothetical protein
LKSRFDLISSPDFFETGNPREEGSAAAGFSFLCRLQVTLGYFLDEVRELVTLASRSVQTLHGG